MIATIDDMNRDTKCRRVARRQHFARSIRSCSATMSHRAGVAYMPQIKKDLFFTTPKRVSRHLSNLTARPTIWHAKMWSRASTFGPSQPHFYDISVSVYLAQSTFKPHQNLHISSSARTGYAHTSYAHRLCPSKRY